MTAPPGHLRRVTITGTHRDGSIEFSWRSEAWMICGSAAAILHGARTGEEWLIRWYQPKGRGWTITEALRCERR